jgi:hypothetical protein
LPKFSDSNYKILNEYFSEIVSDGALGASSDSWLLGPSTGVLSDGGVSTILWEDNPTRGFVAHGFIITGIDGNRFQMVYDRLISTFSLASSAFEIGADMYFRKDSFFHYYLFENSSEYRDFINTERVFAYFGQIWVDSAEDETYFVEFRGMKDYMRSTLPEHNQTDRLVELIKLWFDHINHEPYNMTKYLWALLDAREIDTRWLEYIAGIYGIEIDEEFLAELPLREWVDFLIYFLKRVGTYAGLYIVWRVFAAGSINVLNVYERWDEWCKCPATPGQTPEDIIDIIPASAGIVPSFKSFPNFHPGITSRQYDFHWLENYGISPSGGENGGAGDEWYAQFIPSGYYPSPSTPYPTHTLVAPSCNTLEASASMVITPHYIVEVDLTNEPMGDITTNLFRDTATNAVISESRWTELTRNWEYVRPTGKYVQYQQLIAPLAREDRTGDAVNLYPDSLLGYFDTYHTGSLLLSAGSPTPSGGIQTYTHRQTYDSDQWTFTHGLSGNVIVQTWQVSGSDFMHFTRIEPDEIVALSSNILRIFFEEPVSGLATVAGPLPGITYDHIDSGFTWYIPHNLGTDAPSGYPIAIDVSYWNSPSAAVPSGSELLTDDTLEATWTTSVAGSVFVRNADYLHTQSTSSASWTINHGMNTFAPITQIYDADGFHIEPIEMYGDNNTITVTLENSEIGTAHLIYLERDFILLTDDPLDIMENGISPSSGYWQVGNGETEGYNPFDTLQLESPTTSGSYWRIWEDTNHWYIDFIVPVGEIGEDLSITEVGLFNINGDMIYYSKCSTLFKSYETQLVFHYRALKLEIVESSSSSSSSTSSTSSSSSSNSVSISSSSSSSTSINFGPFVLEDAEFSHSSISSSSSRSSSYSSCSYSPTRSVILPFSDYGDNNYWVATAGSWNGTGWDSTPSGLDHILELQITGAPSAGWQNNFLPRHSRYTFDADVDTILIEDSEGYNIVLDFPAGAGTHTHANDFCNCKPMATLSVDSNVSFTMTNLQFTDTELECPSFSSSSQSSSSVSFSSSSSSFSCGSVNLVQDCELLFTGSGGRNFLGNAVYRSDTNNEVVYVWGQAPYTIGPYTFGDYGSYVTTNDGCDSKTLSYKFNDPQIGTQQIIYLESVASNPANSEIIGLVGGGPGVGWKVYQMNPNVSGYYDSITYGPTVLDLFTYWADGVHIAPLSWNSFMCIWTNMHNNRKYLSIFQSGPTFTNQSGLITWDYDPDTNLYDISDAQKIVYRESGAYPSTIGIFVDELGPGGYRLKCIVVTSTGNVIGSPQYVGYTTPGAGDTFMSACKLTVSTAGSFAALYKSSSEELYVKRINFDGRPMAGVALKIADEPNTEFLGTNLQWSGFDIEEMCDGRILVVGWVRKHDPPTYVAGTLYYWIIDELTSTVEFGPTQIDFQWPFFSGKVKIISNEVKSNFTIYTMQYDARPLERCQIFELIIP